MTEAKKYEYVLKAGTKLVSPEGEYTIKRVLGQGGYGITYQAKGYRKGDNIPHKYAIKELFFKEQCWRNPGSDTVCFPPSSKQETLKDFLKEARRLNKLCRSNRNIVNVNEVFEANGTAYYVMEFLEGKSLRDLVLEQGPLPERVALSYIRPIAEAVEFIHSSHQLLHCDIKPDNIMIRLDEEGQPMEPVLIDFGISIHFNKNGELTTTHNFVAWSKGYSPQEQSLGLQAILDSRKKMHEEGHTHIPLIPFEMDVYALGATLFYLLTATTPPLASYGLDKIIQQKVATLNVSDKTKAVIINAMKQDYMERTATAKAFLKGFEERYYLQRWFVLKSPNTTYQIVSDLMDENECWLKYDATIYTGDTDKHNTRTTGYIVYEYFEKGFSNRNADESVTDVEPASPRLSPFGLYIKHCKKLTGLDEVGECKKKTNIILSELFHANGTTYAVVRKGWKPEPAIITTLRQQFKQLGQSFKALGKHLKSIVKGIGFVAIITLFLYGIYVVWNSIDPIKPWGKSGPAPSPADTVNAVSVDTIQDGDQSRDTQADVSKEVTPESTLPKTPLPSANDIAAQQAAKKKEAEIEERKKREEVAKRKAEEDKKKAEEAKKKAEEEAAQKAMQYLNGARTGENHRQAYQWALKADPKTKAEVIQKLKYMDYPIP